MNTKIKKWGNSLAIRIPKSIIDNLGLVDESEVEIKQKNQSIEIKPNKHIIKYDINKLVNSINKENLPEEIDWGDPVGKEIW